MVASARVAHMARRGADYGVHIGGDEVAVDLKRVRERKRDVVTMFREGSEKSVDNKENIDLLWGAAKFTGEKTVEVTMNEGGTRELSAETVVINVGQRPNIPPIEGLDSVPYLTSTSIMELEEIPEHLLVLGGGYIGLEFAQMFRRFGAKVTIVQRGEQLLPREDKDVADKVADILREDGVTVLLNQRSAKRVAGGRYALAHRKR